MAVAKARNGAMRLIPALVVVALLFGPYFANLLTSGTRYVHMWRTSDAVLLLTCMILLALAYETTGALIRLTRRPFLTRVFDHVFVLALGAALLANLWFHSTRPDGYRIGQFGMEIRTLWLLTAGLIGYSLAKPELNLPHHCRRACLIISPALLILVFQMLVGRTYTPGIDPLPAPASASALASTPSTATPAATRPVYVFLLDAWSHDRTYRRDGTPLPIFHNLIELSEQATVFDDAHSPGNNTDVSMPRFLFQTDLPPTWDNGRCSFHRGEKVIPTGNLDSIFTWANARGYRTFMLGFCVPYRELLGDQVQVCRSYPWLPLYRVWNPVVAVAVHAFRATRYWTDPWSDLLNQKLQRDVDDTPAVAALRNMENDVQEILAGQPDNTFAVFHYPCPHPPYLLNSDGSYPGPVDEYAWTLSYTQGYERNLAGADRLIGVFIQTLKKTERFEEALVIFTSDHAWPHDPEWKAGRLTGPRDHVPLIVKMPGQHHPTRVALRFETRNIGAMIRAVIDGDGAPMANFEQFLGHEPSRTTGLARAERFAGREARLEGNEQEP